MLIKMDKLNGSGMRKNFVMDTNPYLKDPKNVADGICRMVKSSSAVEGIHINVKATEKNGGYQFNVTPQSTQKK